MDMKSLIPLFISFLLGLFSSFILQFTRWIYTKYKIKNIINLYYSSFLKPLELNTSKKSKKEKFTEVNRITLQCIGYKNRLNYELENEIPYLFQTYNYELVRIINFIKNLLDKVIDSNSVIGKEAFRSMDEEDINLYFTDCIDIVKEIKGSYKNSISDYANLKRIN